MDPESKGNIGTDLKTRYGLVYNTSNGSEAKTYDLTYGDPAPDDGVYTGWYKLYTYYDNALWGRSRAL